MRTFILRRLIYAIPTLIGVSIITFAIIRLSPGDPIRLYTFGARDITQEDIEALRHVYGLDKPLPLQYLDWIWRVLHGDFGQSFIYHQDAAQLFIQYIPNTIQLALVALAIQLVVGVPLGVVAALKRGTWVDNVVRVFGVAGHAIPSFWLGLVMIIVFAVQLRWLPSQGILTVGADQWDILDRIKHMLMPAVVLSLTGIAQYSRILRTETLDVLGQDFVRTAHAKGLRERTVIFVHALRNALIPVVTFVGFMYGIIIASGIVVEVVFGWPGLGYLAYESTLWRDFPVLQLAVLVYTALVIFINFMVDLSYGLIDPRVRT